MHSFSHSSSLGILAMTKQQPLCLLGSAPYDGLPTTHYSYTVSANHTIDPVIPPIWNSLPQLAVSVSKVQVSVSFPICQRLLSLGRWLRPVYPLHITALLSFWYSSTINPTTTKTKSLERWEERQMQNSWSASFHLTASVWKSCVVLCFAVLYFLVVQVKVVTSVHSTGMQERWSLRWWTLMEYQ